MLSAGLWLPRLSQNVESWVLVMQVLGVVNALLLIGLYWLQRGRSEAAAVN
jgi:hypothetical protein